MVFQIFRTAHGHCSLCEQKTPMLFVLRLVAGQAPRLEPLPIKTHTGICRDCWRKVRDMLVADA